MDRAGSPVDHGKQQCRVAARQTAHRPTGDFRIPLAEQEYDRRIPALVLPFQSISALEVRGVASFSTTLGRFRS
jgi:hypothetical protein